MSGIWIISDLPERAWELLGKARELSASLGGDLTVFLTGDDTVGRQTIDLGADRVRLMPTPEGLVWETYAAVLAGEAGASEPSLIMVAATRRGKDLAGGLAARLDAACISDCKAISVEGEKIILERMVYGGLAVKKMECQDAPLLATFAPRSFEKPAPETGRTGEVTVLDPPAANGLRVIERRPKQKETVDLTEADLVVGVGRGFENQDELKYAEEVAEALGAEIACSRPIAEFFKWFPEDRYLGISGQVIKSRLYLATGISGQVQHLYGIRDVKTIVAINSDEKAPMMQMADYYIVGDLKDVLPALSRAVQAARNQG